MAGRIFGGEIEKIKPPPIVGTPINIAPLGMLLWDNKEVPPGETTIIDTFGYTYVTLFIDVNRPASITLAEVSRDGIHWRHVGELIKAFDTAGKTFLSLNEEVKTRGVFLYRFLKLRVDSEAYVRITLEATSKLIDLGPILMDILYTVAGVPSERVREVIKEKEIIEKVVPPVPPEFKPLLDELKAIHELLTTRFTNAVAWDHDQKNVTTPGTPVQLPGLVVPDGYALVVMAKSGNKGDIYLGNSKDSVADTSKQVPLEAKDKSTFEVKKASAIWLDADNAGEGAVFWTERLTEV